MKHFFIVFSALIFNAHFANAALQFRASDFGADASWQSADNSMEIYSTHGEGDGWTLAYESDGVVWFGADMERGSPDPHYNNSSHLFASPLEFSNDDTNKISYLFIVAYIDSTAPLMTLVCAPCPLRLNDETERVFSAPENSQSARDFAKSFFGMTNSVSVNCAETARIAPSAEPQLIECGFGAPPERRQVFFGNSPAFSERVFHGGIAEIIMFAEPPNERVKNAVRRYLAARHQMKIPTSPDDGIIGILNGLGLRGAELFSTIILIK